MRQTPHRRRQQGYIMMALLLAVSLVLIALAAGLPAISAELRRQREEELIHRGVQYTRAIRKYYRKYGHYPLSLDQLEDTNHVRFLRRRYKDPITGDDFRLLHAGEVQLSFAPSGPTPTPFTGPPPGLLVPPGSASPPNAVSAPILPIDSGNANDGRSSPSPFVSLSAMGAKGATFGGGPIVGVASSSDKQSFRVFNDKDHYNDWQFVYSPALEHGALPSHPFDGAHDLLVIRNTSGATTTPPAAPDNQPWRIRR